MKPNELGSFLLRSLEMLDEGISIELLKSHIPGVIDIRCAKLIPEAHTRDPVKWPSVPTCNFTLSVDLRNRNLMWCTLDVLLDSCHRRIREGEELELASLGKAN